MTTLADKSALIRAFKDGDSWCLVFPDFVNLQESPAYFYSPGCWQARVLDKWQASSNPAIHLPLVELLEIGRRMDRVERRHKQESEGRWRT